MKLLILIALAVVVVWWYAKKNAVIHNVATGGLPTSNR